MAGWNNDLRFDLFYNMSFSGKSKFHYYSLKYFLVFISLSTSHFFGKNLLINLTLKSQIFRH